jgi:hypothetical protein
MWSLRRLELCCVDSEIVRKKVLIKDFLATHDQRIALICCFVTALHLSTASESQMGLHLRRGNFGLQNYVTTA